jgi:Fe-S cluster assembly ATP-binding protein
MDSTMHMLTIDNLHARVEGKEILKGLSLAVKPGEVHAIMGPNGAGKSTLANVLSGRDGYEVTSGSVKFDGRDLLALEPEERAAVGMFLAFQYPVEIPGVNNTYFLRAALNAQRKFRGEEELDSMRFLKLVREKLKVMQISDDLLHRAVNEGFSGGEKKRNEIFQMAVLEPKLAILDSFMTRFLNEGFSGGEKKRLETLQLRLLKPRMMVLDETDSGLDIDALKQVAEGVNALRSPDRSFLIVTHYQRLLDYIEPDFVHVLAGGRIVESGDKNLAVKLEEQGYAWLADTHPELRKADLAGAPA